MKIAFINDVHVGKDAAKDGHVRAASSKVLFQLPKVFEHIKKHSPDLLINLGDLIRSESIEEDTRNYKDALKLFKDFDTPIIHLLGNHEVKHLKVGEIKKIWQQLDISQDVSGVKLLNGIKFIWLDFEQEKSVMGIKTNLSQLRLDWLNEELGKDMIPTIISSHYVMSDQNLDGNFYFEKPLNIYAEYGNKDEFLSILKKHPQVLTVFSAHTHELHSKVVDGIPHVTFPSMVENIAAPEINNNFPEIYTIVDIHDKKILVKCYSQEYCFITLEL